MTDWPLSEAWDIAVTMSPVRWQQGVTRPSCSPCLADGTPTLTVNTANDLLSPLGVPGWGWLPALGTSFKDQHGQALE